MKLERTLVVVVAFCLGLLLLVAVNAEDATNSCPAGETYTDCSAHCEAYCPFKGPNNITITRLPCANECRAGCACSPGYVRNIRTRLCVLKLDCPKLD